MVHSDAFLKPMLDGDPPPTRDPLVITSLLLFKKREQSLNINLYAVCL